MTFNYLRACRTFVRQALNVALIIVFRIFSKRLFAALSSGGRYNYNAMGSIGLLCYVEKDVF